MELGLTDRRKSDRSRKAGGASRAEQPVKPGWADGLRRLYDSVVEEDLPDSFEDLLKRLDQAGND